MEWKSKGLSTEIIKPITTSDNCLPPSLTFITNAKIPVKYGKSCLKQEKTAFEHGAVLNLYIVYEINLWPYNVQAEFTIENCLFGAIRVTKNVDKNKFESSGYGIGFEPHPSFWFTNGNRFRSSSTHVDNKKKVSSFFEKVQ